MSDMDLYPTSIAKADPSRIAYRICETGEAVTY